MKPAARRVLFWFPRILAILFALFLALFATDVFMEGRPFGEALLGFVIHLVPTYVVLLALLISWRWEWVGAVLFIGFSLFYLFSAWGRFHWAAYVTISGPAALTGILFGIGWFRRGEIRER